MILGTMLVFLGCALLVVWRWTIWEKGMKRVVDEWNLLLATALMLFCGGAFLLVGCVILEART